MGKFVTGISGEGSAFSSPNKIRLVIRWRGRSEILELWPSGHVKTSAFNVSRTPDAIRQGIHEKVVEIEWQDGLPERYKDYVRDVLAPCNPVYLND